MKEAPSRCGFGRTGHSGQSVHCLQRPRAQGVVVSGKPWERQKSVVQTFPEPEPGCAARQGILLEPGGGGRWESCWRIDGAHQQSPVGRGHRHRRHPVLESTGPAGAAAEKAIKDTHIHKAQENAGHHHHKEARLHRLVL